jgi:hypothetical protein
MAGGAKTMSKYSGSWFCSGEHRLLAAASLFRRAALPGDLLLLFATVCEGSCSAKAFAASCREVQAGSAGSLRSPEMLPSHVHRT